MKAIMRNSYPYSFIHSASAARAHRGEKEERAPTVHLPQRIRRVCMDFNIRAVFKSGPTLPMEQTSSTKYHVPARWGEMCLKEHKDA